jgi:hypothetical protein
MRNRLIKISKKNKKILANMKML